MKNYSRKTDCTDAYTKPNCQLKPNQKPKHNLLQTSSRKTQTLQEAATKMGFHQHLMIDEEETKRTVPDRVLIKRLLAYMVRYRLNFAVIVSLLLVSSGLGLVGPYILAITIDKYIPNADLSSLYWV